MYLSIWSARRRARASRDGSRTPPIGVFRSGELLLSARTLPDPGVWGSAGARGAHRAARRGRGPFHANRRRIRQGDDVVLGPDTGCRERAQALKTLVRIPVERHVDDRLELRVDHREQLPDRPRALVRDPVHHHVRGVAGKGLLPGQQLVHDEADREDVAAMIGGPSHRLLGRHVVRRTQHRAGPRQAARRGISDDARETEVEDLENAVRRQHQVRRLDVAVDDPHLVRVAEAGAQLEDQFEAANQAQRRSAADDLAERLAIDVLHRDERLSLVLADIVDGDDVGMGQTRRGAGFPGEPLLDLVVEDRQDLERNGPIEDRIAGQIQQPHAALAQAIKDFVPADSLRQRRFHDR